MFRKSIYAALVICNLPDILPSLLIEGLQKVSILLGTPLPSQNQQIAGSISQSPQAMNSSSQLVYYFPQSSNPLSTVLLEYFEKPFVLYKTSFSLKMQSC